MNMGVRGGESVLVMRMKRIYVLCAVMGIAAIISGIYMIHHAKASQSWPSVKGTIMKLKLEEVDNLPEEDRWLTRIFQNIQTYSPEIHYQYEVGDRIYTGDRFRWGQPSVNKITAKRILARYTNGQEVLVYYDPKEPGNSVLEPGPWKFTYFPIFGGVFCLFVIYFLWIIENLSENDTFRFYSPYGPEECCQRLKEAVHAGSELKRDGSERAVRGKVFQDRIILHRVASGSLLWEKPSLRATLETWNSGTRISGSLRRNAVRLMRWLSPFLGCIAVLLIIGFYLSETSKDKTFPWLFLCTTIFFVIGTEIYCRASNSHTRNDSEYLQQYLMEILESLGERISR